MNSSIQSVREAVMALSLSERASLAHELILSLDEPSNFNLGSDQEREISRRVRMVREGTANGRASDEVFRDIKADFGK